VRQIELPDAVADLAIAPDGQTLAVAHRSRGLGVYNLSDGSSRFALEGHFARVAFRSDGRWLLGAKPHGAVVGLDGATTVFDFLRVGEYILDGEFPDDDTVAFVSSHYRRQLRLPTATGCYGEDYRPFLLTERILDTAVPSFLFQPIGIGPNSWLVGAEYDDSYRDHVAVILDSSAKRLLAVIDDPTFQFSTALNFRQHDGWFALASNREIMVFHWGDVAVLETPRIEPRRRGLFGALRATLVGQSRLERRESRYGRLPTLRPRFRIPAQGQPPTDSLPVAFLPSGETLLCRGAQSAVEWRDLATCAVRTTWQFGRAWPRALAVAPDGLTAYAAMKGGTIVAWDLE
jgi:hypothetical protein